ncbi:MAG: short-chain dehydrogenase [Gallionellales bacterium 35-53-114]|jgi:short-subunit dehydrogenase|nr:MAG: short-chain dehydrogenase [Gallionellales bacterium 35-53-114]OYZ63028.1 MAG: short-chain dehydrogenase [Gallionellales bacterium 24-53-125]OZB08990.1 MAG: short-chain dehydrogenase [Gallionellales bacterium 39-52-133]HQS59330.1 SDR family NAD(P)-dependent oxidoreductase [Gallionellaceae bacterium]HQS76243.1 SDR family NAD(P)-dependent oxidoreductase [Gallionellaceae bacterium]
MNPKISDWHNKRVWVIGASTGIGAETARLLLENGARVALSARRVDALKAVAKGREHALVVPLDIVDHASVLSARDTIRQQWQSIDLVLVVAGTYNEMRADTFDLAVANQLLDMNIHGVFNCLDAVLPGLLAQGSGGIGIVASVAGFRGLPKALVYGPSKAALINLCESLYLDLRPRGIAVYLINPGFVETPLTAANDFRMPALISARTAARELVRGLERGEFHIHFPRRFTNWMRVARLLPYRVYFWLIRKGTGL